MKNNIVIYFSGKGNNKYLADKIASELNCEKEEIRPRIGSIIFVMLGLTIGNRKIKADLSSYDRVILCGPIWMGKFVSPLRKFVSKYRGQINELVFATCCASSFERKNDKYGHGLVFREVEQLYGKEMICEAFPLPLVVPEEMKDDHEAILNVRLDDSNFTGKILDHFRKFITKLKS